MSAAKARQSDFERVEHEPGARASADPERDEPAPIERPALAALNAAETWGTPAGSPALDLQDQLHNAFAEGPVEARWSYRRTAAFLLVTCGGFWTSVALLINQLV